MKTLRGVVKGGSNSAHKHLEAMQDVLLKRGIDMSVLYRGTINVKLDEPFLSDACEFLAVWHHELNKKPEVAAWPPRVSLFTGEFPLQHVGRQGVQ